MGRGFSCNFYPTTHITEGENNSLTCSFYCSTLMKSEIGMDGLYVTPPIQTVNLSSAPHSYTPIPGIIKPESLIEEEFQTLHQWSYDQKTAHPMNCGKSCVNINKNRYSDIVPFDANRVILKCKGSSSDYINASHIQFPDLIDREYIACQAPIPATFYDFWWMIWEQKSCVIACLTELVEGSNVKAHLYWPDKGERLRFGKLVVSCLKTKQHESITVRSFTITLTHTNGIVEQREVYHFHYTEWNNKQIPKSSKGIRNLSKLMDLCQQVGKLRGSLGPAIVHCSAGIGRTGTFIAVDQAIMRLQQLNSQQHKPDPTKVLNLFELVRIMRSQRTGMVQTLQQYEFIYKTVSEHLESSTKKLVSLVPSVLRKRTIT